MSAVLDGNKLYLFGSVSEYSFDEGFSAMDVLAQLARIDDNERLDVHVNSVGGDAFEGAAIHALLVSRKGVTNTVVEGIAASAGSLIAMAGKTVTMASGSVMMIHDVHTITFGNADAHQRNLKSLDATSTAYARVYAAKSGKTVAQCRAMMKQELWLEPHEAVAEGFADQVAGSAKQAAAFDYRLFAHAPQRLVALAQANNWSASKAAKTPPLKETETTMTTQNPTAIASAKAAATTRLKAILQSEEAKDRTDLAEHLAYETEIEPEQAQAILAKAAKVSATAAPELTYEQTRLLAQAQAFNPAQNLARPTNDQGKPNAPGGLVASMKRRHGIE